MFLLLPIRFIQWLPKRLVRVVQHTWMGLRYRKAVYWSVGARPFGPSIFMWWMEWIILWLDVTGVPEWYEMGNRLFKWNTRPLIAQEAEAAKEIYGDSLPWDWIRMDSASFFGPPQMRIAYVSFCTINYWRQLRRSVFIHELMHVLQFHHFGSIYMVRALTAQRTKAGYNYGGPEALRDARTSGKTLWDFNYEQQADIIADYWRLKHGKRGQWTEDVISDLSDYSFFVDAARGKKEKA